MFAVYDISCVIVSKEYMHDTEETVILPTSNVCIAMLKTRLLF